MSTPKVFAHYMVSNRDYGGSVQGYKQDIQDAQAQGVDGFALNCGSWNSANYKQDTESMFQAAEQLGTGFLLFFSCDMSGLSYPEIMQMVPAYVTRPNYFYTSITGTSRPVLSTWGGDGGAYQGTDSTACAYRWKTLVINPLKALGINVFFMPKFDIRDISGNYVPAVTPQAFAAQASGLLSGLADGWFNSTCIGTTPDPLTLATAEANIALLKTLGIRTMASISPQYWQSNLTNSGRVYVEYDGGEGLRDQALSILLRQMPDWIELFTWNDFREATDFSPIDDVNKYWPYIPTSSALGFFKQRVAHSNEMAWYIQWFKMGAGALEPAITGDTLCYYHRTMPNLAVCPDPLGQVYGANAGQGPQNPAPNALDVVFVTTRCAAPATIHFTSGNGVLQTAEVAAGRQYTRFAFSVGPQTISLLRGGAVLGTRQMEPIVATAPAYNFLYSEGVISMSAAPPLADYDIVMGPALASIAENSVDIVSGSDGSVHSLVTATHSDTGTLLDLSGAPAQACLVPQGRGYDPAKDVLLPAIWLPRTAAPAGEYLRLPVGPDNLVAPAPGTYRLYAQITTGGEIIKLYSAGYVVFH